MRDEDHIRQFMPVLRRIIILVAVLTAIPVAMWTITAFVRTYIGPPKAPDYQPMALTPSVNPDQAAAAPVDTASAPAAQDPNAPAESVVVARASATDADTTPPAADPTNPAPAVGGTAASSSSPAPLLPAAPAPPPAPPSGATATPVLAAATPGPAPTASQTRDNAIIAAQQVAPTNWPAPPPAADDAMPAGEPIAGTVPLPRRRPHDHDLVVAQSSIPLPRPRPGLAGPGAPAQSSSTPLDWIHNIFQPSTGAAAPAATPAAEDSDSGQAPR